MFMEEETTPEKYLPHQEKVNDTILFPRRVVIGTGSRKKIPKILTIVTLIMVAQLGKGLS
jgi:hypothetical protein